MSIPGAMPIERRPRLLAIDHSTDIHRLLKVRLKRERLEIHSATDSAQGIEAARSLMPEVILLNVDMPGMDGFEVLSQLKSDTRTHDIPVIFLSEPCSPHVKIRGLEMGAVDFVIKPFDMGELVARVRSALRIRQLIQMLAQRARVDGLTGLWNRAYFDQRMEEEIAIARRHHTKLALILCDLDRFKTINDTYGHPFGDQVLEGFGRMLAQSRAGDSACRYGGEEFAIILPRADAADAAIVAERLRQQLREQVWSGCDDVKVTASFGITDLDRVTTPTAKALIESADQAMYAAKCDRDCISVAADTPTLEMKRTA